MLQRPTVARLTYAIVLVFPLLSTTAAAEPDVKWAIVVHGGAGSGRTLPPEDIAARKAAMRKAIMAGREILAEGGAAIDAVQQVIQILEDDPLFNAGRGAVLNSQGGHELDASIMDGRTKQCGAVAGVTTVKNPILLARRVMTETRHVLLGGRGAEQFAKEQAVELVENSYFRTEAAVRSWQRAQKEGKPKDGSPKHKGTVGCAALDQHGNLAAGTSTGGLTNKKFGRIGDSPIIGAGTYADNATCAVSCTGIGEQYIRNAIAYDISAQMKYGQASLNKAVGRCMRQTLRRGDGGIIAVSHKGEIVMDFTTAGMARAAADSTGRLEILLLPSK